MAGRRMLRLREIVRLPRQVWSYARLEGVSWLEGGDVAACRYPRDERLLRQLADRGVKVLINLHEQRHPGGLLARYGLTEVHLPVPDFTPPTPAQLQQGVTAIEQALAAGHKLAVHCGGGLGRTGTLLACYLVTGGLAPDEAIRRIRSLRPGSVETPQQVAAVTAYAQALARSSTTGGSSAPP